MIVFEFLKLPEFFHIFLNLLSIFYDFILISAHQKYIFFFPFPPSFSSFPSQPGPSAHLLCARPFSFLFISSPPARSLLSPFSFSAHYRSIFLFPFCSLFLSLTGGACPSSPSSRRDLSGLPLRRDWAAGPHAKAESAPPVASFFL